MTSPGGRRSDLLDAATTWVLENGLSGLSLRPLARDLGTSDRMLIYHFGTKDGLVDAVLVRANEQLAATLTTSLGPAPSTGSALWTMWQGLTRPEATPYVRLYFEVYGLALQQPDRYRPGLLQVHRAWLALVATRLWPDDPTDPEADRRATVAVAVVEGHLLDLLVTGDTDRVEGALRSVVDRI